MDGAPCWVGFLMGFLAKPCCWVFFFSSQIRVGGWCVPKDTDVMEVREVPEAILVNHQHGIEAGQVTVVDQDVVKADH